MPQDTDIEIDEEQEEEFEDENGEDSEEDVPTVVAQAPTDVKLPDGFELVQETTGVSVAGRPGAKVDVVTYFAVGRDLDAYIKLMGEDGVLKRLRTWNMWASAEGNKQFLRNAAGTPKETRDKSTDELIAAITPEIATEYAKRTASYVPGKGRERDGITQKKAISVAKDLRSRLARGEEISQDELKAALGLA